jgi:hypothetical protein
VLCNGNRNFNLKVIVFWNVMLCNLIGHYKRFRRLCCLHLQGRIVHCPTLKMEGAHSSEMLVMVPQITQCHYTGDSDRCSRHCENFMALKFMFLVCKLLNHEAFLHTAQQKKSLVQLLCFWTLSIIVFLFKTDQVSETGFYLRLQVEPTQLGPIDRASP